MYAFLKATLCRMRNMLKTVEDVGKYDGSDESIRRAQTQFDDMVMHLGCYNQNTSQLYWKTLKQRNLYIPLTAWYAFAVGECLQCSPPDLLKSMRDEAKTPEADIKQRTIYTTLIICQQLL
jgi:hypothetical protein